MSLCKIIRIQLASLSCVLIFRHCFEKYMLEKVAREKAHAHMWGGNRWSQCIGCYSVSNCASVN